MGHLVRVWVGSSSGWVMFGLNDVSGRFGSGRVWFGSGRFRVNQFLVKYARNAKTSNFVENFGSGQFGFRVRFRVSIFRVSGWVWVRVVRFGFRVSGQFCQDYINPPPKKNKKVTLSRKRTNTLECRSKISFLLLSIFHCP